jgi:hypothetical protein
MPAISIDGITVNLNQLLESLKLQGNTRDKLKEDQAERAKKFGIKAQEGAPLTIPARFVRLGIKLNDFADRVNYRFPVWLTKPDRESLTPTQLGQVRNAKVRFAQFGDRYDPMSRAAVERRIDEARKKFEIGEFAETEKSWECQIFKRDEEKRVALSVALKASGGANGIRADSQKDILTAEEVEKTAYGFMLNSRQFDLHHKSTLPTSRAAVVESYLAPVDFQAGRTQVKAGDWIVGVHFADPVLWQKVRAGEIQAFSIKGTGKRRPVQEQEQ